MAPLTINMLQWITSRAQKLHHDSSSRCLADIFRLGINTGFRISEYAQYSTTNINLRPIAYRSEILRPVAICCDDLEFRAREQIVHPLVSRNLLRSIDTVYITWFHQKNNQNGERIPFKRVNANALVCPVRAALRLYLRAKRLNSPYGLLGYSAMGPIISSQAEQLIKRAASAILGTTDRAILRQYNTHSLRVGAANLMRSLGISCSMLKDRLRWLSDAYQVYLRNTIQLATQHAAAYGAARPTVV